MSPYSHPQDAVSVNDLAGALAWYEAKRESVVHNPVLLHGWARLLCSLDRRAEAEWIFDLLADSEDYGMFAVGQRLIGALERGLSPEQALAATPLGAMAPHRDAMAAAMAEFDITRRPPPARHIAISGVSFCGSTLMDLLLEGLPGVASIGESVWLTLNWANGGPAPRTYSAPQGKGIQECNRCGRRCEYLTPNFRNALALNPIDWYFRIAERLQTKILVSADKNLDKLVLFDPRFRFQGLVVFKSPKQAWASNYTKMAPDQAPEVYVKAMTNYMKVWKNNYSTLTRRYAPLDGKVFLNFDRFADAPEQTFKGLARALGLEYDPAALIEASPGHSLGGNGKALKKVRDADHHVNVTPLGEPAIPADHAEWIDAQDDLTELYQTMRTLSEDALR